jgi:ADP-ribosyl-[dinitrogen reductase] hydrolase
MTGDVPERGLRTRHVSGLLLGTAVGDAVGLPREGLSARRAARLFGPPPCGHRLLGARGMVSDDTEHAVMTAEAFVESPQDPARFARALARRFRWWLAALPAGVGFATLRSGMKLWLGVSPERSGVYSAGNGPAMRAPVLGVLLGDDPERLRAFVRASTRLTHTDERAYEGALAVALAARLGARSGELLSPPDVVAELRGAGGDDELRRLLDVLEQHLAEGRSPSEYATAIGVKGGVTGFMYQTVPVALYCWLRFPSDFRAAVESILALGGDADTTAAIVGALAGATLGPSAIPLEWRGGLLGPPSLGALERVAGVAAAAAQGEGVRLPRDVFAWPRQAAKNAALLTLVLAHGFRRLAPPY